MKLAKVVGTVVSTIKSPIFEGRALLLVDLVGPDGREAGGYLIALDTVGAGAGETVLVLDEGTSARQVIGAPYGPLRTVVVGIVDAVEGPASVTPSGFPPTPRRRRSLAPGPARPRRRADAGSGAGRRLTLRTRPALRSRIQRNPRSLVSRALASAWLPSTRLASARER